MAHLVEHGADDVAPGDYCLSVETYPHSTLRRHPRCLAISIWTHVVVPADCTEDAEVDAEDDVAEGEHDVVEAEVVCIRWIAREE